MYWFVSQVFFHIDLFLNFMIYPVVILYGSNDKKLSLLPYSYCHPFLLLCLKVTPLFPSTKKSRLSADVCQDLAIYGLFSYAHHSKFCINLNHLCSTRSMRFPRIGEPNRTSMAWSMLCWRSSCERRHWTFVERTRCRQSSHGALRSTQGRNMRSVWLKPRFLSFSGASGMGMTASDVVTSSCQGKRSKRSCKAASYTSLFSYLRPCMTFRIGPI